MSNAKVKPVETEELTPAVADDALPAVVEDAPSDALPVVANDTASAIGEWQKNESARFADYLSFVKGTFYAGADKVEVPLGTLYAADVDNLCAGWICWENGQVKDQLLGLVGAKEAPSRASMGNTDNALWPKDGDGVPQDPFKELRTLPIRNVETGQQFTLTTSSFYGNRALLNFVGHWNAKRKANPDKLPILKIGAAKRPTTHWGDVDVPVFSLVEWRTVGELDGTAGPTQEDLDDDIPF